MYRCETVILIIIIFLAGCAGTGDKTTSAKDSEIIPPVLQIKPEFIYPEEAREKGIEGVVDIYVYINDSGNVRDSRIVNSSNSNHLTQLQNFIQKAKNIVFI